MREADFNKTNEEANVQARLVQSEREIRKLNREIVHLKNAITQEKIAYTTILNQQKASTFIQRERERYLTLLLANSPSIILFLGQKGRIEFCTDYFITKAGYKNVTDVLGHTLTEALSPFLDASSHEKLLEQSNNVVQTNAPVSFDITFCFNHNGEMEDFAGLLVPMKDEQQHSNGIMLLFHDVTDLKRSREEALAASQSKSSFLSNMSHEIRTPMNAIIGITELLLNENLDSRKLKYVNEIHTSAKSLLGIINDILDLSKINEGKLAIIPADSDITTLLKNIASLMVFSAQAKGLNLIEDIRIDPREYVRIDETRINQVLLNLLSNAIKFTNSGCVKFEAVIEGGNIVFKVSDTGIGIKPKDQPLIFNAFEQVDIHKNRNIKGTGLGLSITKNLVEMMGGNIWVESEYGVGTTFYVTIPYVQGNEPVEKYQNTDSYSLTAPTAHVLIVDDIQANLTVGAGLMRLHGITADMALSGRKAMELIALNDYDIIFMDHMMPEEDGVEVTKNIRKLGSKYEKLPIVALTANALNEAKELLLNSGMDDFLAKPIDRFELIAILKKWLPTEKIEYTSKTAGTPGNQDYSEALQKTARIDGMDIKSALKRLGGMQEVLEQSIVQTAYSISDRLHIMDECLTNSDLKRFSIEAHGFKSALANIGATDYSILAAELENSADAGHYPQCAEKFTLFNSVMENFATELKSVFPKTNNEIKSNVPGDLALLAQKVTETIEYLENFETDDALACMDELLCFTYGNETDNLLDKAKRAIEAYDKDEAIRILNQSI